MSHSGDWVVTSPTSSASEHCSARATCRRTRIEALPTPYSRLAKCRSETPVARASALRVRPRRTRKALARSPSAARNGSLRSSASRSAACGSTLWSILPGAQVGGEGSDRCLTRFGPPLREMQAQYCIKPRRASLDAAGARDPAARLPEETPMTVSPVEPPPEAFNFAAHLLEANAGRPAKTAFIDDIGALTYGELDERARRFAAALKERGVKREERVLILMQDGVDWPVAFLGAMLAGSFRSRSTRCSPPTISPICSNIRAPRPCVVSGAVKPALKAALAKSDHEVHTVVVSRPAQPLEAGEIEFEDFLAGAAPLTKACAHACRRSRVLALFVGLDRQAQGDGAFARQPLLDDRALRQGDPGPARERRLLLRRQALLRLWARQRADLSARGRRDSAAHGRAADAGGGVQALDRRRRRRQADRLLWRADRLRRHARFEPVCRSARMWA